MPPRSLASGIDRRAEQYLGLAQVRCEQARVWQQRFDIERLGPGFEQPVAAGGNHRGVADQVR